MNSENENKTQNQILSQENNEKKNDTNTYSFTKGVAEIPESNRIFNNEINQNLNFNLNNLDIRPMENETKIRNSVNISQLNKAPDAYPYYFKYSNAENGTDYYSCNQKYYTSFNCDNNQIFSLSNNNNNYLSPSNHINNNMNNYFTSSNSSTFNYANKNIYQKYNNNENNIYTDDINMQSPDSKNKYIDTSFTNSLNKNNRNNYAISHAYNGNNNSLLKSLINSDNQNNQEENFIAKIRKYNQNPLITNSSNNEYNNLNENNSNYGQSLIGNIRQSNYTTRSGLKENNNSFILDKNINKDFVGINKLAKNEDNRNNFIRMKINELVEEYQKIWINNGSEKNCGNLYFIKNKYSELFM